MITILTMMIVCKYLQSPIIMSAPESQPIEQNNIILHVKVTLENHFDSNLTWQHLNDLSTHPVVRPHVLLSNPKEVLQWSLPTCSEKGGSDERHWEHVVSHRHNGQTQTVPLVWVSQTLPSLSALQSTKSWLKSGLVYQEMMKHGLIYLCCSCPRCHLALQCFAQDNLLHHIKLLCSFALSSTKSLFLNEKWQQLKVTIEDI